MTNRPTFRADVRRDAADERRDPDRLGGADEAKATQGLAKVAARMGGERQ
jgi:hypothetical protein